jgi:AcrR family transcriptional regulator
MTANAAGRPRSERAKEAILRTTLTTLEQQGLNGLTIEGVAADAGVGKATIYRWWPSRLALVLEAMEQLPELRAPDTGSFAGDLRALLGELSDLLVSTPLGGVLAHIGGDPGSRDAEVHEYLQRRMAGGIEVVERAIGRGELPRDADPETLVFLAVGPLINRVFFGPPPDDENLDLVVAMVSTGLPRALEQRAPERKRRRAQRGAPPSTRRRAAGA